MSSTNQPYPDSAILAIVGGFLISECVEIATYSVMYGIFVLVFAQSTSIFLQKHLSSHAHVWMFLTSALSFILAGVQGGALLADAWITIEAILVNNQDMPLDARQQLANTVLRQTPIFLLVWTSAIGPIISDCIVVWRAFVLLKLQHKQWLVTLPLLLLLGSIATTLTNAVLATMGGDIEEGIVDLTYMIGLHFSLATNVVATTLIGYLYWLHRKDMVPLSSGPTQGMRVLVILVESGVAFCVPQAISALLATIPLDLSNMSSIDRNIINIFITSYFAFAWMYPTVVIVLVNRRYTLDHCLSNSSLPHINFVRSPSFVTPRCPASFAQSDSEPPASFERVTEEVEGKNSIV